ncbi:MAG: 4-(cytidine 5'-diphospho)-2-C-methyl-D-erythritol kinase [Chlorobi bacterium]|nr:4-(cytidine 5'-diphospho)-2-C-methyl-D-erythritol kinase [Chlorobiota bacterium]
MISFPNAKINLGLSVVEKRRDNYHNIETVFFPIGLKDVLEVVHSEGSEPYEWSSSGLEIDAPPEKNICIKALDVLKKDFSIGPVKVHLHKVIPFGAGLGGGSADGAAMLMLLNDLFELGIDKDELKRYAVKLGADCSFFIDNESRFATGIGDMLYPVEVNLSGYYLGLVVPPVHVSTPEAYRYVTPRVPDYRVNELINLPAEEWKGKLKNDFEDSVFKQYPELKKLKYYLYDKGAVYASMSGSGSSVFGIFREKPEIDETKGFVWIEKLK